MQQPDLNAFRDMYNQHGILTINNLLPEELATSLVSEFDRLDWKMQIMDSTGTPRLDIPLADIENRDNLIQALYDRDHDLDLNNLFYVRLATEAETLTSPNMVTMKEFLNSENFLNKCRYITGNTDLTHSWLEATCYDKGCFLNNHTDDHHPGNRVAFVLNLTRTWKADWGGLLMLQNNPNTQPMIIPPTWNSLTMFRVPVNHAVSGVNQAATEHRYSITGWLRPGVNEQ